MFLFWLQPFIKITVTFYNQSWIILISPTRGQTKVGLKGASRLGIYYFPENANVQKLRGILFDPLLFIF